MSSKVSGNVTVGAGASTRTWATRLVTTPTALDTTQYQLPTTPGCAARISRGTSRPASIWPLRYHWYESGSAPVAKRFSVWVISPANTRSLGCWVMVGPCAPAFLTSSHVTVAPDRLVARMVPSRI
jgi:hypothetical protein